LVARKAPLALVVIVLWAPVRVSTTTTSALFTGAPLWSSTLPLIDDVVACEKPATGTSNKAANASKESETRIVLFIRCSASDNREVVNLEKLREEES
jgi:hypothetical protein